jgi:hypothetical protein
MNAINNERIQGHYKFEQRQEKTTIEVSISGIQKYNNDTYKLCSYEKDQEKIQMKNIKTLVVGQKESIKEQIKLDQKLTNELIGFGICRIVGNKEKQQVVLIGLLGDNCQEQINNLLETLNRQNEEEKKIANSATEEKEKSRNKENEKEENSQQECRQERSRQVGEVKEEHNQNGGIHQKSSQKDCPEKVCSEGESSQETKNPTVKRTTHTAKTNTAKTESAKKNGKEINDDKTSKNNNYKSKEKRQTNKNYAKRLNTLEILKNQLKENNKMNAIDEIINKKKKMNPFEKNDKNITWVKIELIDIMFLPIETWMLINNTFLINCYKKYKHLILGRDCWNKKLYLGVPDIYYYNESMIANLCGFNEFVCCRDTYPGVGEFGYWIIETNMN